MAHVENIRWRCRNVDPDMSELDKVSHLMKEVVEYALQLIMLKNYLKVTYVSKPNKTFEEGQRSCLDTSTFGRLPNIASCYSPVHSTRFGALVRQGVREVIRVTLPEHFHSSI